DAYGNQKQMVGQAGPGQLAGDFGFTGFHEPTGLNLSLTLYRAYDPTKGGWLSRDPLGKGASLYAYAGGGPLGDVDPLGLDWQLTFGLGGSIGSSLLWFFPGPFVGLGVSGIVTSKGQFGLQFSANGSIGYGTYFGAGAQGGISHSAEPSKSGLTTSD